ncbi:MAG: glycosyltransferase family 4 protein [Pseudomonadota bacterium]
MSSGAPLGKNTPNGGGADRAAAARAAVTTDLSRSRADDNRPATILQIVPSLDSGGVERGTLEIAEAITAAGGRSLVASEGGRLEARLRLARTELIALPLRTKNPWRMRANAQALADVIRTESVDIVHARSRAPAWSAYAACKATGATFVTTYHGTYSEGLPLKRRYNRVMTKGERVIAISRFVAEHIRARHLVDAARLITIPRGADTRFFDPTQTATAKVAALSHRWGLAEDLRPVILMPGRLTRWKGQTLFIEALALLRKRRGSADFIGVLVGEDSGDGRFETELHRLITRHKLDDAARLVGHCEDMPSAYKLASCTVSASLEPEAFGRVAVESQAMGVPVIASAHGGAMETVMDDVTGWLFESGDASALAAALDHALSLSEERRKEISAAAIAHVREHYSVKAMQEATVRIYADLAAAMS